MGFFFFFWLLCLHPSPIKHDSPQSPHLPVGSVFVMKPPTWHVFGTCCLAMMSLGPCPQGGSFPPKWNVYSEGGVGWKARRERRSRAAGCLFCGGLNPWHSPGLLNCLVLEVDVELSSCSWFCWEAKGMVPWTSPGGKKRNHSLYPFLSVPRSGRGKVRLKWFVWP